MEKNSFVAKVTFNVAFIIFFLSLAVLDVLTSFDIAIIVSAQFSPVFILLIQMQFLYALYLINFTFNDFIFSITHPGLNQKKILDIVFMTRSHIFLSEIYLKLVMKFLVLIFLIGRSSVSRWSLHLVGGQLVGGRWQVVGWSVVLRKPQKHFYRNIKMSCGSNVRSSSTEFPVLITSKQVLHSNKLVLLIQR